MKKRIFCKGKEAKKVQSNYTISALHCVNSRKKDALKLILSVFFWLMYANFLNLSFFLQ